MFDYILDQVHTQIEQLVEVEVVDCHVAVPIHENSYQQGAVVVLLVVVVVVQKLVKIVGRAVDGCILLFSTLPLQLRNHLVIL